MAIIDRIARRVDQGILRSLPPSNRVGIDLYSNDYLGLSKRSSIVAAIATGSTGSRLLSGNSIEAEALEEKIANFHGTEAALLFNSGYDANLGLLSALLTRHDTVLYDELVHASIRDGIRLGDAKSFSFRHNDLNDLRKKLKAARGEVYIVVESIYSMDGDLAPLKELNILCKEIGAKLIVDEAHAAGVFGKKGEGLCKDAFARVYTYGKAMGCHGASVVGSKPLKDYLINFARSFIYTTALPPHSIAAINNSYTAVQKMTKERDHLHGLSENAASILKSRLDYEVLAFNTQIIGVVLPDNQLCRSYSEMLEEKEILVSSVLSPTVPKGRERLRICLHSYNNISEIERLCETLLCYRNRN